MSKLNKPVQMAIIGAAHGIKGELRVKAFTGDPLALGDYGPLSDSSGRRFEIAAIRPAKEVVVVRFKGVNDRTAAEALQGTELFVDRSVLPADVDDGEFYYADLIGLAVRDEGGNQIGRVTAVQNFGGGDLLELALAAERGVLIPFTQAAVPEVDVAAGFISINGIAAGLVEDENDGDAPQKGDDRIGSEMRDEAQPGRSRGGRGRR